MKEKYAYDIRNILQQLAEDIILEETEDSEDLIEMEESEEEESDSAKTDSDYSVAEDRESTGSDLDERPPVRRPITRQSANSSESIKQEAKNGIVTRSRAKTVENEIKKEKETSLPDHSNDTLYDSAKLLVALKVLSIHYIKLIILEYSNPTK